MKAILACDPLGGIGMNGSLPWKRLDGDMPRFRELTNGHTVVMGRLTWNSLPIKPLPSRTNIVVSSKKISVPFGVQVINGIEDLPTDDNTWFIGGAKLLEDLWDRISEIHLTRTFEVYDCDTYIDLLYLKENFTMTDEQLFDDNSYEVWVRK